MESKEYRLSAEDRERIDRAIAALAPGLSRSQAQRLIAEGNVLVEGVPVTKASAEVLPGQVITVSVPAPTRVSIEPEEIPLDVVFEDKHLVVVNKPRGMVVHPAPGHYSGTLVNALLWHCAGELSGVGGKKRPGIVHRLDKDTTGLIVSAKSNRAHIELSKQIRDRSASRLYLALVHGYPGCSKGIVDAPVGRHPVDRKRMAVVEGGRAAITRFVVKERLDSYSLIQCALETGRTHQIRVHMAYIKTPVVCDPTYGPQRECQGLGLEGQALHAWGLHLTHPVTQQKLAFEAPLPPDFEGALKKLRLKRESR